MSEVNFFPQSDGSYRGSKYPGFVGGTTDTSGNVQQTGSATNVGQATGNNLTAAQVQQQQVEKGQGEAATSGSLTADGTTIPTSGLADQNLPAPSSLGGTIAAGVLPAAGGTFGGAAVGALEGGSSIGDALGSGAEAVGSRVSSLLNGNFGSGLLGSSAGSSGASAAGSTISGAGTVDGLAAENVGVSGIDGLGTNAVSEGVGSNAASEAGSSAAGSSVSGLGAAGFAGVGTFISGLLSGQSVGQSAIQGVGSAIGGYAGGALAGAAFGAEAGSIVPGIGTAIGAIAGGLLASLLGNKHPTVGPNGGTLFDVTDGQLAIGKSVGDNGFDPNTQSLPVANNATTAINKILSDNNLQLVQPSDTGFFNTPGGFYPLGIYGGAKQDESQVPSSTLGLWNYLVAHNYVQSKTPSAANDVQPGVGGITTVSGSSAPVHSAGSTQS